MVRAAPLLRTYTPGDLVTAAFMNAINYAITFGCLQPPQVECVQTVSQNLTTNTQTAVLFDTEIVDSDTFHSTASNTSRVTAPWPAWYQFTGGPAFAANATGRRGGQWAINGTAVNATAALYPTTASGGCAVSLKPYRAFLNAGDYVELDAFQDSGSTLGTAITTTSQTLFTVSFVSF